LENSGYGLFADFDRFTCYDGSGAYRNYDCEDQYYIFDKDLSKGRSCVSPTSLTLGDYYAMVRHGSANYLGKTYNIKAELIDCEDYP
jgi:hypothetical protein